MTPQQFELGRRVWRAFTGDDPLALDAVVREDTSSVLPFLSGALRRLLEEFPASATGLPRTERHILELLAREPRTPEQLFRAEKACEGTPFACGASTRGWAARTSRPR